MKKHLTAFAFALISLAGCRQQEDIAPTPIAGVTGQQWTNVNFLSSQLVDSTTFTYDSQGFMVEYTQHRSDSTGKTLATTGGTLTYNAQGLLDRVDWFGVTPGGYETYTYADGKLKTVTFFEGGRAVYQYGVLTNATGEITGLDGRPLNSDPTLYAISARYVKNSRGVYQRIDLYYQGTLFAQTVFSHQDTSFANPYSRWKGVPFDITLAYTDYVAHLPAQSFQQFDTVTYRYVYDQRGTFTGLRTIGSTTDTRSKSGQGSVASRTVTNEATRPSARNAYESTTRR